MTEKPVRKFKKNFVQDLEQSDDVSLNFENPAFSFEIIYNTTEDQRTHENNAR